MVEVTLKAYISVHGHDRMDLTPSADFCMRIVPTCAVVSVLQVDSAYLKKKDKGGFASTQKDKGGFRSMVEVTLKDYISVHRRDRTNLRPLAGSYMPVLSACAVVYVPQVDFGYLKKKTRVGLTCDFSATSTMDRKDKGGFGPWSR